MKRPGWAGGSDCLDGTDQFLLGWSLGGRTAPPGPSLPLQPLCLVLTSGHSFRKITGVSTSPPGWGAISQGLQVEITVSLGFPCSLRAKDDPKGPHLTCPDAQKAVLGCVAPSPGLGALSSMEG